MTGHTPMRNAGLHRLLQIPLATVLTLFCCACSTPPETVQQTIQRVTSEVKTTTDGTSTATTIDAYKVDLARRISQVGSLKVHAQQPQALLRAVIVIKFYVNAGGELGAIDIVRTNHDKVAEATAMATLKDAAPFPKPAPALLKGGRVEVSETWLFNNDGRFQLRSIAQRQKSE